MTESDELELAEVGLIGQLLLSSERTLLAWVRTALALQAAGIGVLQFVDRLDGQIAIGIGLLLLGATAGLIGFVRFRATNKALRRGQLPPPGGIPEAIALGTVLVPVGVAVAYLIARFRP